MKKNLLIITMLSLFSVACGQEFRTGLASSSSQAVQDTEDDGVGDGGGGEVCITSDCMGGNQLLSCYFNGQSIQDGEVVQAFFVSSAASAGACTSEYRTCTRGTLSGTASFSTCNVTGGGGGGENPQLAKYKTFVEGLFQSVLGRPADTAGRDFFVQLLVDQPTVAKCQYIMSHFFESTEFKSLNASNSRFLQRLFEGVLDRDADDAGFNFWLGELNKGMARSELVSLFTTSSEASSRCRSIVSQ